MAAINKPTELQGRMERIPRMIAWFLVKVIGGFTVLFVIDWIISQLRLVAALQGVLDASVPARRR
jgi:hypothetical protein